MAKVLVLIRGQAVKGRRDDVRELFEKHLAPHAVGNEAQEVVVWAADDADPDGFVLVELYRDQAALQANGSAPWFAEYMAAVQPLLAAPPEFGTATPLWSKPS